jgi:hypothetical protein
LFWQATAIVEDWLLCEALKFDHFETTIQAFLVLFNHFTPATMKAHEDGER